MQSDTYLRLRNHPAVKRAGWPTSSYGFECATCGDGRVMFIRYAVELSDGTLACQWCVSDKKVDPALLDGWLWCKACRQRKPPEEFTFLFSDDPQTAAMEKSLQAAFGTSDRLTLKCHACQRLVRAYDFQVVCAHCAEPFYPGRKTARYCSGKCRVAAHRAKR